jgi:hypothetical protein
VGKKETAAELFKTYYENSKPVISDDKFNFQKELCSTLVKFHLNDLIDAFDS